MSYLKTKRVQLGDNVTASNNFVLRQPDTADGTMRISNGIVGAETDLVTVTSAGNVGVGTSSPSGKLDVVGDIKTSGEYVINSGTTAKWTLGQSSDALYFYSVAAGLERMRIDTAGRVTMPYQPGFHVANSGTPATSNFGSGENSLLHFDYVVSNVGSGWNTSSKRYTAPVTGRYMIYAQVRFDSLTTYSRCWVSTNGGTGQWWNLGLHSISPSGTFNLWTHTITGAIPLAAGDYIELRGGSNNSVGYHEGEGSFGGYLVG